jgi:ribonuclease P protein component
MLPKEKRLNKALFKKVIDKGKSLHSKIFIVRFIKDKSLLRFAVSVSKKVSKSAVIRNKIRRRVYSSINSFKTISPTETGNIIFIVKPEIIKLNLEDIKLYTKEIFVNLGLLK